MPVTGNEEAGLKPLILRHSSGDYPAGIPIKKRRYPIIRPPSPPPDEEPTSSPVDSSSLQRDQSSPSQGSTLSYSSVVTNCSSLSDAIKSAEPELRTESCCTTEGQTFVGNANVSEVKIEEPTKPQMSSLDIMGDKDKFLEAGNPLNQMVSEGNKLNSAAIESLARDGGISMGTKQIAEAKVEAKTSEVQKKSESLMIATENFCPDLSSQIRERSVRRNHGMPESISLNLSLSKESIFSSQCKTNVDALNVASSSLFADRANWDLNTPMDTWAGLSSDIALGQNSPWGIDAAGLTRGVKQPEAAVSVAPEKRSVSERKNLSMSSDLSGRQSDDSLNLRLSPLLFNKSEQSTPILKLSADKAFSNAKLPRVYGPSSNLSKVNIGAIKLEPVEESSKLDARVADISNAALVDSCTAVKRELVDQSSIEALKSLNCLTQKSVDPQPPRLGVDPQPPRLGVDPQPVKPEPALESIKETVSTNQGKSFPSNERSVQGLDKQSTAVSQTACSVGNSSILTENELSRAATALKTSEMSSSSRSSLSTETVIRSAEAACNTAETTCPLMNTIGSVKLARGGDLLSNSGQLSFSNRSLELNYEAGESSRQGTSDTGATITSVDGKLVQVKAEDSTSEKPEVHESKLLNDLSVPSRGNLVGTTSDDEKINISADIEVSYGSDYESDGNHDMDMSVEMEIESGDDYEDGEVRESLERIAAMESACEEGLLEHGNNNDLNTGTKDSLEAIKDAALSPSQVEVRDAKTYTAETGKNSSATPNAVHGDQCEEGSGRIFHTQESTVENILAGVLVNETSKAAFQSPVDQSDNRGAEEYQERDCRQVANGGIETLPTFSYGMGLTVNGDRLMPKNDVALSKSISDANNAAKDIDNGSQRSRIINLPRSSGSSSPGRTRTFSGRLLPARAGRERLSDLGLEGDKMHSRGREDIYFDGSQKFSRERHHDQAPRNSRFNFVRGRGRISNRLDNVRGDRESDREFASEYYNGPTEFRVPRHKFASSVPDADLEYNSYNAGQDVAFVNSGRGGRKPLNDGGSFVRRMPARRRSPGAAHGTHVVRRISRNISPNRCVVEDGSELVRPRRSVRGYPDDGMDPVFTRPQPSYEAVDDHFAQGNRNFPSGQRRVMHRIRSKSPVGSRARSPGVWSSPRRRSPDGFAGLSDLNHQRSPPFYRMERLKSPDRRCFPGEVVVRRQDMRDLDSGRDHGHLGSGLPNNRSPSSRIVIRERRFGGLDPQERPEGDDFYGGPMSSGRLHDLGGDGNGDERRFSERRAPVRPYRTYNGADGENFHLNSEDASRPLRFCPDNNTEFQERSNLVERDFNRRIKNRPAPRRIRNIEEQEVNYRHSNQVWHNNEFDEMSRVKRKRY